MCVLSFKISEYFSITLSFLVFLCLFVVVSHLPTYQVDPSFKLRKHFRKAVSFGIYEIHKQLILLCMGLSLASCACTISPRVRVLFIINHMLIHI